MHTVEKKSILEGEIFFGEVIFSANRRSSFVTHQTLDDGGDQVRYRADVLFSHGWLEEKRKVNLHSYNLNYLSLDSLSK